MKILFPRNFQFRCPLMCFCATLFQVKQTCGMFSPGFGGTHLRPLPTLKGKAGGFARRYQEAPMATLKVTDATFKTEVDNAKVPVVVDFWAEWCGPCKMIGPSLEEIAEELQGQVTIAKLNVDENPGVAGAFGIRSIPTLLLFKNGKMASSKIGAAPKGELKRWISAEI